MMDLPNKVRPMLAAQKYRKAGDLWSPLHEGVVEQHLKEDGFLWMQPKIDGMRTCFDEGVARSRSWKPLGNKYLQAFAKQTDLQMDGIDGEVVSGHIYDPTIFKVSMSGIRAEEGSPEFSIYMFDNMYMGGRKYSVRKASLMTRIEGSTRIFEGPNYSAKLIVCPTFQVTSLDEIYRKEAELVEAGWEGGIIRRDPLPYKFGRSTALGGELVKLKRRQTSEAVVTGYFPWEENQNEATISPLGYTVRSAHQDGKVALERLGGWTCHLLENPSVTFKVGSMRGVTHTDRDRLWQNRDAHIGDIFEFSHDGYGGGYEAPRTPIWLRWRSKTEF